MPVHEFGRQTPAQKIQKIKNELGCEPKGISLCRKKSLLNKINVKNDFSMGFVSNPGFRAGTSNSYFFYDLDKGIIYLFEKNMLS